MDGVGGTGSRLKWHTGEDSGASIHLFLNNQAVAINEGLVPVVAVGPAQHIAKVTVAEGSTRAACKHFRVGSTGTKYRAVTVAAGIGDKAAIA